MIKMDTLYQILVIDDNAVNLKLMSELLTLDGFIIKTCFAAEEALVLLQSTLPQLILMDIALPGMDGLQLTHHLKSDERTRHLKIVAVTAFAMKSDQERITAAGCDGYISKPINTRTFITQIKTYL